APRENLPRLSAQRPAVDRSRAAVAATARRRPGLHATALATGEGWPRSDALYDSHGAGADREEQGVGGLLQGRQSAGTRYPQARRSAAEAVTACSGKPRARVTETKQRVQSPIRSRLSGSYREECTFE